MPIGDRHRDHFGQLIRMMADDRLLQLRVVPARRLDQQADFMGLLDRSLPALYGLNTGQQIDAGRQPGFDQHAGE